jgi:hypothetical protein
VPRKRHGRGSTCFPALVLNAGCVVGRSGLTIRLLTGGV